VTELGALIGCRLPPVQLALPDSGAGVAGYQAGADWADLRPPNIASENATGASPPKIACTTAKAPGPKDSSAMPRLKAKPVLSAATLHDETEPRWASVAVPADALPRSPNCPAHARLHALP